MLRDVYEAFVAAVGRPALHDSARDASTGPRKPSAHPALGQPYGRQGRGYSKPQSE